MISKEQLSQIAPAASAEALEKFCRPLNDAMEKFAINTPARIAAFLAQLAHESDSFRASVENLNYSAAGLQRTWPKLFPPDLAASYAHKPEAIANRAYGSRMGNGNEASGDGWRYRGRGPIGITGKDNYRLCGEGIGADLIHHPELLEGPVYGAQSAAWFWSWRGLNKWADLGTEEDYKMITKRINGGFIGLESRLKFWEVAKKVLVMMAIVLLFGACASPLIKAKRHWNKIEEILLKHPEIADSLALVKHDTVRVKGFTDHTEVVNDSTVWNEDFFASVDTLAEAITKADHGKKAAPVTKLQQRICPSLTKDSTYHVKVYNSDVSMWVPVHLAVKAKDGKITIDILTEDLRIPDPQIIKSVEFKSLKPKFYADQWFWVAVMLFVVLAGFIALSLRRK